jgi:hypothetical protein
MQDRYVGDIGDFGKYGLLRMIANETNQKIGVIWYLFGDETHNADGRHIGYLQKRNFISPDPFLHAQLSKLLATGKRSVRSIARSGILPQDTIFFDRRISGRESVSTNRQQRARFRAAWLRRALNITAGCDLVFMDPDNGIETASVHRHSPKSGKYVYWDELEPFWNRGQSLLIYHHLNRTAPVRKQSEILRDKFATRFPDAALLNYFLFRRGSCRHFWLVAQANHAEGFQRTIDAVTQSEWRAYFEVG